MPYTELTFQIAPLDPGSEILMAQLAEIGFEAFEDTENGLRAYIRSEAFDENTLREVGIMNEEGFRVTWTVMEIMDENWNSVWESSYPPVNILGQVYIRASFHPVIGGIPHNILIDPKMSFGTAHHETTAQMIEQVLMEKMKDRDVLDMGCGTAVLAILAEQLGAVRVVAIDNDPNAVENARENVLKNNCTHIDVLLGTAHEISGQFDFILANINKNILVQDMPVYASHLRTGGVLLVSGFYEDDLDDLRRSGSSQELSFDMATSRNNWVVARFVK